MSLRFLASALGARRLALRFAVAMAALPTAFAPWALAQGFPAKAIHIVIPAAPGGTADILGRLLSERLSKALGQPVLIDNKPGASLMLGTDFVAKAAPDGYTLLLTNDGPLTMNPSLYPKIAYDAQKDFVPVAKIVSFPMILVVNPAVPATTTGELIALAKAQPGKLNFGAGGATSRIAAELFRTTANIDVVHVPYKGSAPMVTGLLGNEVQFAFDGISSSMSQVKAAKLRALAVTGSSRIAAMPNLPTVAESGLPGYEAETWIALFAPAGVPKDIVAKLYAEVARVMAQPDMKDRLADFGMTADVAPSEKFMPRIRADTAKWSQLIKNANITAE